MMIIVIIMLLLLLWQHVRHITYLINITGCLTGKFLFLCWRLLAHWCSVNSDSEWQINSSAAVNGRLAATSAALAQAGPCTPPPMCYRQPGGGRAWCHLQSGMKTQPVPPRCANDVWPGRVLSCWHLFCEPKHTFGWKGTMSSRYGSRQGQRFHSHHSTDRH